MKEFVMMRGLPGSGKSTWALEMVRDSPEQWVRINNDSLQLMMTGRAFSKDKKVWKAIEHIRDNMINESMGLGMNIVIDNTNLSPKREQEYRDLVDLHNKNSADKYKFSVMDFTKIPVETCIKQNQMRPNPVPDHVIYDMYEQFIKPKPAVIVQDKKLRKAIISDIDGTIARHTTRSPYDNTKYYTDAVIPEVLDCIKIFLKADHHPIFLTGRDEVGRADTLRWLADKCGLVPECCTLLMRPAPPHEHSKSHDYDYKKYMFDTYVRDKYYVTAWFEDRVRNVNMARNVIGLQAVFQVNEGNF